MISLIDGHVPKARGRTVFRSLATAAVTSALVAGGLVVGVSPASAAQISPDQGSTSASGGHGGVYGGHSDITGAFIRWVCVRAALADPALGVTFTEIVTTAITNSDGVELSAADVAVLGFIARSHVGESEESANGIAAAVWLLTGFGGKSKEQLQTAWADPAATWALADAYIAEARDAAVVSAAATPLVFTPSAGGTAGTVGTDLSVVKYAGAATASAGAYAGTMTIQGAVFDSTGTTTTPITNGNTYAYTQAGQGSVSATVQYADLTNAGTTLLVGVPDDPGTQTVVGNMESRLTGPTATGSVAGPAPKTGATFSTLADGKVCIADTASTKGYNTGGSDLPIVFHAWASTTQLPVGSVVDTTVAGVTKIGDSQKLIDPTVELTTSDCLDVSQYQGTFGTPGAPYFYFTINSPGNDKVPGFAEVTVVDTESIWTPVVTTKAVEVPTPGKPAGSTFTDTLIVERWNPNLTSWTVTSVAHASATPFVVGTSVLEKTDASEIGRMNTVITGPGTYTVPGGVTLPANAPHGVFTYQAEPTPDGKLPKLDDPKVYAAETFTGPAAPKPAASGQLASTGLNTETMLPVFAAGISVLIIAGLALMLASRRRNRTLQPDTQGTE